MPVREFTDAHIKKTPNHSFMVLSAARKAGKSHLCSHIVRCLGHRFGAAFVCSTTSKLQNAFPFIDQKNHYDPNTDGSSIEEYISTILKFQADRLKANKPTSQILLICDDLFTQSSSGPGRFSKALSRLAATGRHLKIFTILITQRWASLSPSIRSQATDWISFRPRSSTERTMLTQQFLSRESGSARESRQRAGSLMAEIFDGRDSEYKAMWIRSDERSSNLDDIVHWCRAPEKLKSWTMKLIKIHDDKIADEEEGKDEKDEEEEEVCYCMYKGGAIALLRDF